jgi:class 3 adenylate cyclase
VTREAPRQFRFSAGGRNFDHRRRTDLGNETGQNVAMARLRSASLDDPAVRRPLGRGTGSMVRLGPLAIGRAYLEPGWRWSKDLKPVVGTAWCEAHHLHVLLAGSLGVEMDDGERGEFGPGEVFEIPPGHDTWVVGDETAVLLDVSGNVAEFGLAVPESLVVATMLMTDIVGSTALAARIGDSAWRQRLERHNRLVRSELARFRGREIDTTGDGFLAAFDSAAAGLRCAIGIRDGVADLGLEVRIGVHTGEVDASEGDVRGIAVHATARIMAAAGPQQILTSGVTRAIAAGPEFAFGDRGPHELKGIPAPVELFEVAPSS